MLNGIPALLTPELLKVMMEMGHGDELVLADGNYPLNAHPDRVIRLDGHGVCEILQAVLPLFPLDRMRDDPVLLTQQPSGQPEPPIWKQYRGIIRKSAGDIALTPITNIDFYARTRKSTVLVTTSETALYANLILVKGVVVNI